MSTPSTTSVIGQRISGYQASIQLTREALGAVKALQAWAESRRAWTVTIDPQDRMHTLVRAWLAKQSTSQGQRTVAVTLDRTEDGPPSIEVLYDPLAGPVTIRIRGHRIRVTASEEPKPTRRSSTGDIPFEYGSYDVRLPPLRLIADSQAGRQAVIAHLAELAAASGRRPSLHIQNGWGGWSSRPLPARPIASVILNGDLAQRAMSDLQAFLSAEEDYTRLGMPWHRGYLFHGPPGTGKTSLATAMAYESGLDVRFLSLGSMKADGELTKLVADISPRSILLIEDVDVFAATHEREATTGQVTMSGLLNVLDGVITPHGLVTILSTNHIETIDQALLRPGRADFIAEIGMPDYGQIMTMIKAFAPEVFFLTEFNPYAELVAGTSTAQVVGIIKEHLNKQTTELATALNALFVEWDGR